MDHNMDMNHCMVMQNGFQVADGKESCIVFLFRGWNVDSTVKYAFMLIGVVLMGFLNGALVYLRHRLLDNSRLQSSLLLHQLVLSLMYGIQMVLAYWMMLLVMTYETGIFVALLFGLTIGYFIFGYIEARNRILMKRVSPRSDSPFEKQFNSTACCQASG